MKTVRSFAAICALSAAAATGAAAQDTMVPVTGSDSYLALTCLAGAEKLFGASNATIVGASPIPGGMAFDVALPGQADPWSCRSIRGEAYD
ncbi:hypothetical protein [Roseivivax sp. CAU 1761]